VKNLDVYGRAEDMQMCVKKRRAMRLKERPVEFTALSVSNGSSSSARDVGEVGRREVKLLPYLQ
jgi:hypothetical protein